MKTRSNANILDDARIKLEEAYVKEKERYAQRKVEGIRIAAQHQKSRSSHTVVFCKNDVLRNFAKFTGKRLCKSLFFNKVAGLGPASFIKKETLAQVFSCEFCEFSKNTFSYRTPPVAASAAMPSHMLRRC